VRFDVALASIDVNVSGSVAPSSWVFLWGIVWGVFAASSLFLWRQQKLLLKIQNQEEQLKKEKKGREEVVAHLERYKQTTSRIHVPHLLNDLVEKQAIVTGGTWHQAIG